MSFNGIASSLISKNPAMQPPNVVDAMQNYANKYVGTTTSTSTTTGTSDTPGILPKISTERTDDETTSELEKNTKDIVKNSRDYMMNKLLEGDINGSIAGSLLTYVVSDTDPEKYEVMNELVDYIIAVFRTISDEYAANPIVPVPVTPTVPVPVTMFGGSQSDIDELLNNVLMSKDVVSYKVRDQVLYKTKNIIKGHLSTQRIKDHISKNFKDIFDEQIKDINDEINAHKFTDPPKPMLGGSHYLKADAIESVRMSYLEKISAETKVKSLTDILRYSIYSVLKFPQNQPPSMKPMNPIIEKLIDLKDYISNRAIEGFSLPVKIDHIMKFIDGSPELENNMIECVKTQIKAECLDGIFVRIRISTPECVKTALDCIAKSTQDETQNKTRSEKTTIPATTTSITRPNFPAPPNPTVEDIKSKYQSMLSFVDNKQSDAYAIPSKIWDKIWEKMDSITDVSGSYELTQGFVDSCLEMYKSINLLSNNGLFVLFNNKDVIDKINNTLLLFSDFVLNSDLPTCDNPSANPDPPNKMERPPNKPSKDDSANLIVFLLKHHMRHMGENKPNVIYVSINESLSNDSRIYEGFETELNDFIEKTDKIKDKKTTKIFTDILFKKFIEKLSGEFRRARYLKDMKTVEEAHEKYINQTPTPTPTPTPSYGGANTKTRRHRHKRNKKTRRCRH